MILTVIGVGRARRASSGLPADDAAHGTAAVIVAARNEADSMGDCVRALSAQTRDNLRFVIVDDRSTDATGDEAERAAAQDPRFTIIRRLPEAYPGKKAALLEGIKAAGEVDFLLFTDADCAPGPRWAEILASHLVAGAALVAGYSPHRPRRDWVGRAAGLETAGNAVMASGLIGLGSPVMCTARNLGYTRAAYEAEGGLAPLINEPSGDDTLMLQRIARGGRRIRYTFDPESYVTTEGPRSLGQWFTQKTRHLSTVRRYPARALGAVALVRAMDALVGIGLPLWLLGLVGPEPLWAAATKVTADAAGLWLGLGALGERKRLRDLPLLELLHSPLLLAAGLVGLIRKPRWKS